MDCKHIFIKIALHILLTIFNTYNWKKSYFSLKKKKKVALSCRKPAADSYYKAYEQ